MCSVTIMPFENRNHREQVVALWQSIFRYETPHNNPHLVIDRKIAFDDGLFFVAVVGVDVVGTVMAGYDGHRGWIYSVAVHPNHRKQGIGSDLVKHAERVLVKKGCVKINLQILQSNYAVAAFYRSLGYSEQEIISMGKRIDENIPVA